VEAEGGGKGTYGVGGGDGVDVGGEGGVLRDGGVEGEGEEGEDGDDGGEGLHGVGLKCRSCVYAC
jgi:hypothetical protein